LLCLALLTVYVVVLAWPGARSFFELVAPGPATLLTAAVGAGLSIGFLWLTDDRFLPVLDAHVASSRAQARDAQDS
jgi:hypothetical protein